MCSRILTLLLLLVSLLVISAEKQRLTPLYGMLRPGSLRLNSRQLRSESVPLAELADQQYPAPPPHMVQIKREKPMLMGYGWEQCEFSPMSCLLRRRRSANNA
ncbi:unnamed protein product [Bursaphelenchus okinawaensis]|uniref:Uncharacterized protein n=1 Tax=Bursaphelenchus okinawaensis TaxID=465554 RepID=A0A811K7F9_9BILA|nr:unnamed protein product [Bursaphelenchus okinawaensis]CAG9094888.1 unnamed protein product [Bursaphelenchus okinawaensis]